MIGAWPKSACRTCRKRTYILLFFRMVFKAAFKDLIKAQMLVQLRYFIFLAPNRSLLMAKVQGQARWEHKELVDRLELRKVRYSILNTDKSKWACRFNRYIFLQTKISTQCLLKSRPGDEHPGVSTDFGLSPHHQQGRIGCQAVRPHCCDFSDEDAPLVAFPTMHRASTVNWGVFTWNMNNR